MAAITTYGGGLRRVQFSLHRREAPRFVRLGRVSLRVATEWKRRIEDLIADRLANRPHEAELSRWLGELDEKMRERLRTAGLVEGVGLRAVTLAPC